MNKLVKLFVFNINIECQRVHVLSFDLYYLSSGRRAQGSQYPCYDGESYLYYYFFVIRLCQDRSLFDFNNKQQLNIDTLSTLTIRPIINIFRVLSFYLPFSFCSVGNLS